MGFSGSLPLDISYVSEVQRLSSDGEEHVSVMIKSEREGNPPICHNVDEPGGHYAK